jgi:thiosulfate/3-mercaptopyruvate sulfurtransferase
MKTPKVIIVAIVVIILGLLVVYSQTGLPEKKEGHEAAAAGYGGGGGLAKAPMPRLSFISLPGDEGVIPPGANLQLLARIEEVEKNVHHWVIVDCRDKESYNEGHIPSAIHLGETCNDFFRGDLEVKGQGVFGHLGMRPVDELEKKLGAAGISMGQTVVFYDGKMGDPAAGKSYGILAGYAFVPFWFMEYLGHQDVRVLDGGIMAWSAAGKSLETKENRLSSTVFKANVLKNRLATTEELVRAASDPGSLQVVDTRTPAEYAGKSATPPNHFLTGKIARAGHVPGVDLAAPHFYQFADMETMKLRPIWQLKRIYSSLDTGKRTVAYCILGNRSSMAYFVMRLLGFKDPANYHDSWVMYGNTDGVPVEQSL